MFRWINLVGYVIAARFSCVLYIESCSPRSCRLLFVAKTREQSRLDELTGPKAVLVWLTPAEKVQTIRVNLVLYCHRAIKVPRVDN